MKTYTYTYQDSDGNTCTLAGWKHGCFLLYRPWNDRWSVLHIPTGLLAVRTPGFKLRKEAVQYVELLDRLGDWSAVNLPLLKHESLLSKGMTVLRIVRNEGFIEAEKFVTKTLKTTKPNPSKR